MQERNIDGLVNEITARVKERLNGEKRTDPPCVAGHPGPECESCQGCHVHRADDVRNIIQVGASRIGGGLGDVRPDSDLAGYIDHTLLKPEASREELQRFCEEAMKYGFASVCVNASNIKYCASLLYGSNVLPIAVVGFPLGAMTPSAKGFETREAVRNGAKEIDMVINIGALKSKDYSLVLEDIASVVGASQSMPVKVILENASLTRDEKVIACVLSKIAGAAFVKTSTGFGAGGGACVLVDTPDDRQEDRSTDVFYEGNGLPVEDRAWDSGCGPLPDLSGRGLQAF